MFFYLDVYKACCSGTGPGLNIKIEFCFCNISISEYNFLLENLFPIKISAEVVSSFFCDEHRKMLNFFDV